MYRFKLPIEGKGVLSYVLEYAYCFWKTMRLMHRAHRDRPIDAIHVCNPPDIFFPLGRLYKRKGARFVFDQHDPSPELYLARFGGGYKFVYKILRMCELLTYKTSDAIIVTNESARQTAIFRGKLPPQRVHVVRNGPYLLPHADLQNDPNLRKLHRYLVCCIGSIAPQDGVDQLLRAAIHLIKTRRRKDICFAVVGGGTALGSLKKLAEQERITDHVVFTGHLNDIELLCRYVSSADVCVSPEPKNSCNNICTFIKVLDYMAFGKPIVAYDLLETRRSASDGAVYATPNDPCDLGDKIAGLLDDPAARRRIGEIGQMRMRTSLHWEFSKKELLNTYTELFESY